MIKKIAIVALSSIMWFTTAHAVAEFGFVNKAHAALSIICHSTGAKYTVPIGNYIHFQCEQDSGAVGMNYRGVPVGNIVAVNLGGCWIAEEDKDNWSALHFIKAVSSDCGMR